MSACISGSSTIFRWGCFGQFICTSGKPIWHGIVRYPQNSSQQRILPAPRNRTIQAKYRLVLEEIQEYVHTNRERKHTRPSKVQELFRGNQRVYLHTQTTERCGRCRYPHKEKRSDRTLINHELVTSFLAMNQADRWFKEKKVRLERTDFHMLSKSEAAPVILGDDDITSTALEPESVVVGTASRSWWGFQVLPRSFYRNHTFHGYSKTILEWWAEKVPGTVLTSATTDSPQSLSRSVLPRQCHNVWC